MAIWKRKKKSKESEETLQKAETAEGTKGDISSASAIETPPAQEQHDKEASLAEKSAASEVAEIATKEDISNGVILYGKKISGFFGKGFWGLLSILILPPIVLFAFGILFIVFMLIFPLLAVVLVASVPVVLVTLSIFLIAIPVLFPLLVLFLLITGKGRLLIGSEGKWFGLEMFGKNYSLK